MTGNCYIDEINIYTRFGVRVTKGGYKDLLAFPALCDPDKNDWPEEDGIEADLSAPRLQEKEITVSFLASNPDIDVCDFIAFITTPGYRVLYVPSLGRAWRLRLSTQTKNKRYRNACDFALTFVEDTPERPDATLPDPGLVVHDCGYELDGVSLADYGTVIDVAYDELLKSPAAKQNLSRKVCTADGQIYDADRLVFSSKEVTFKCHFKAVSTDAFWQCYDALFSALIQPEERELYVESLGESYPCYYKKSSGFKVLSLRGPVVVEFNLTLVFTVFRVGETEYLLATEDGLFIETEDGESLIDMA